MALKTTLTQPTASGTGTVIATPGMPGAANPVRIVGRNASGAPTTGTFQVGDVVVNTDGTEYVCSVAGTPGTWVQIGAISYGTPVNIDASITSLSTGSLTTVARADHVHTITNADVLLASTTLSSTTASITFSSLSGTWPILKLVGTYRVTEWSAGQALTEVRLRLNTDTGSNYIDGYTSSNSATYTTLGPVNTNSNFNASGAPLITHICNADSTSSPTRYKIIHTNGNYNSSTTAISTGFVGGWPSVWKSTAAVTSVTLITFSTFLSGTHVRLYGLS